ncbi:sulfurtransferase [Pengzhenrongella sp.]|jgi:thiosulfate/3-mercaptopyruvate sulfurtransferase|uniref:sulfurtransferase n=1 Tax=Pengzhenrongella sp. TaxID=2888820 RepID=UPI002F954A03
MTTDAADPVRAAVLIEPAELALTLEVGEPVVLLDVRWSLGGPDGRTEHAAGHIPGAVFVDLETELAAPPSAAQGRHPLPSVAVLQAAARRWGVRAGVPVVAYDASGGTSAARAWWLLRWAGFGDVRLLDGGLAGWLGDGGALERGAVEPAPGDVTLTAGALPSLDADDAEALAVRGGGLLLDARAEERYRGEVEPIDPRAGHIPGAVSAPTTGNLDADGRFLDAAALRDRFAALGVATPAADPAASAASGDQSAPTGLGVYCGSGVTAAHEVAALASIGIEAALYTGSWSQWSADPARDVAVGPDPLATG